MTCTICKTEHDRHEDAACGCSCGSEPMGCASCMASGGPTPVGEKREMTHCDYTPCGECDWEECPE